MNLFDVSGGDDTSAFGFTDALTGMLTAVYRGAIPAFGRGLASSMLSGNLSASSLVRGMAGRTRISGAQKYFAAPVQQATENLTAALLPALGGGAQSTPATQSGNRAGQVRTSSSQPTQAQIAAMLLGLLAAGRRNL